MGLPPRDFKSLASTRFATRAQKLRNLSYGTSEMTLLIQSVLVEAEVGIEPAYAELQSAA